MGLFCTKCGTRLVDGVCPKCHPRNTKDDYSLSPADNPSKSKDINAQNTVSQDTVFSGNDVNQGAASLTPGISDAAPQTAAHTDREGFSPSSNTYQQLNNQQYPQQQYPQQQYPAQPYPQQPYAQQPYAQQPYAQQYPQQGIPNPPPVYAPPPVWLPPQPPVTIIVTPETKKQRKKREKQEKKQLKKNKRAIRRKDPKRKKIKRIVSLVLVFSILFTSLSAFYVLFIKQKLQMLSSEGQFATVTGKFTDIKIKNSDSAIEAAKEVSESIGILQAADELTAKGESSFDGTNYYRLQQNYKGTPVYGRDIVVLAGKNGTSQGAMSNLLDIPSDFEIDTSADADKIIKSIRSYFSGTLKVSTSDFTVEEPEKDKLVIYTVDEDKEIYSAYNLTAYADGVKYAVIVDSSDGTILLAAPEQVSTNSQGENQQAGSELVYNRTTDLSFDEILQLCDEMNIEVFNADGGNIRRYFKCTDTDGSTKYYDIANETWRNNSNGSDNAIIECFWFTRASDDTPLTAVNGNLASSDIPRARSLMCAAINTVDFYKTVLGRNSFDNADGYLPIVLDDNLNGDTSNAYSSGTGNITMISVGSSCRVTPDLVGHEFTHSVITSECDLIYKAESGALNEGLADIFGEATDDWCDGVMDNDCDWDHGSRNISNPTSGKNPAKYKGDYWGQTWQTYDDHGHVHKNSTVISHAAYLMNTGTDGTTPIPMETLTELLYRTILTLPSNASFSCFRQYVEDNARLMKLSREYKETIKAAFDEVGIENGATEIDTYSKNVSLTVFDINAEEYTDYTLEIEGKHRSDSGMLSEYTDSMSCSSSPMEITFENFGTYLITVKDRGDSDKSYSKLINVVDFGKIDDAGQSSELKILTSFGDPFFDSGSDDEDSVRMRGQLRDTITNEGISGARVTVVMDENGTSYTLTTDGNGYYQANVKPGLYYITCSANGYNKTYSSALVDGNTTIRKPILLLWTDERLLNNPLENWLSTLLTYIKSIVTRAIESVVWETMDSAIGDVVSEIPFLEDLINEYL